MIYLIAFKIEYETSNYTLSKNSDPPKAVTCFTLDSSLKCCRLHYSENFFFAVAFVEVIVLIVFPSMRHGYGGGNSQVSTISESWRTQLLSATTDVTSWWSTETQKRGDWTYIVPMYSCTYLLLTQIIIQTISNIICRDHGELRRSTAVRSTSRHKGVYVPLKRVKKTSC